MVCLYNTKNDCDACGICKSNDERVAIWDFTRESGREQFLDDLWNFIFAKGRITRAKGLILSRFLQRFLEDSEAEILECAERHCI